MTNDAEGRGAPVPSADRLLEVLTAAQAQQDAAWAPWDYLGRLLDGLIAVSHSAHGFIGEAMRTEGGGRHVLIHALTDTVWNEATRRPADGEEASEGESGGLRALVTRVLGSGRRVIANEPTTGGALASTRIVQSFLGIPVLAGDQVVGVIGLADRRGGFDARLAEFLKPLVAMVGAALVAQRIDQARRRAETALRESEVRHRGIVDSVPDGIVTSDEFGAIESLNPAVETMFGRRREELIGHNVRMLMPERWAREHDAYMRRYRTTGVPHIVGSKVEVTGLRRDGTEFPMTVTLDEMQLPSGRRFVAVLRDITHRKLAEEGMLEASARLSTLIERMTAAVMLEGEPRRVTLVNRRFCEMFGMPVEPSTMSGSDSVAASEHAMQLFADPMGFVDRIDDLLEAREPVYNEIIEMADGRVVERDYVPLWKDTEYAGHFWLYRDVTDRRLVEQALRDARDAAERANRAKAAFLAGMSHEIRTPMSAIVGYSDILARGETSQTERVYATQQIRRNAEHMLTLLNDILDLSRIEAGRMPVDMQPTTVPAVLAGVVPPMRPRAAEKGIALGVEFAGPVPARIQSDAVRLRQVLLNLVSNAVKFTDAGGVTVRVGFAAPHAGDPSGQLTFAVEDTGIGIDPARVPELFHAFSQVHDTRSRGQGGTGLGLAITKRLVAALGGDVSVTTTPGVGSRFTVRLPVAPEECARLDEHPDVDSAFRPLAVAAPLPRIDGRRVLVVDDNIDNQRIARFLLEDAGASVATADDGHEGVEAVHAAARAGRPYDIVLMDMQMPVLDGLSAARLLRSQGVTLPVVALTASSTADDTGRALEAGCDAYLTKPIVPEDLLGTIARLVRDGRPAAVAAAAVERVAPTSSETGASAPPPPAPPAVPAPAASLPATRSRQAPSRLSAEAHFAALVGDYVGQLPARAEEIRAARAAGDGGTLRTLAHRLRGTGSTVGFPQITERAAVVEDALRAGASLHGVEDSIDGLLEAMAAAAPPAPPSPPAP